MGGGGLKNHINIECPISKTGPDPLKITKLPSCAIIGTPAKRHFADGPMMAPFIKKRSQSWTPSDKSF